MKYKAALLDLQTKVEKLRSDIEERYADLHEEMFLPGNDARADEIAAVLLMLNDIERPAQKPVKAARKPRKPLEESTPVLYTTLFGDRQKLG